jgi:hypothetical protein
VPPLILSVISQFDALMIKLGDGGAGHQEG